MRLYIPLIFDDYGWLTYVKLRENLWDANSVTVLTMNYGHVFPVIPIGVTSTGND